MYEKWNITMITKKKKGMSQLHVEKKSVVQLFYKMFTKKKITILPNKQK